MIKPAKKTTKTPTWHLLEVTSALAVRTKIKPGKPSTARRALVAELAAYTKAELIVMFANGIEGFSWTED